MNDLHKALGFSFLLTLVIVLIELAFKSKVQLRFYLTMSCLLYLAIVMVGCCCTTLVAVVMIDPALAKDGYPGFKWFWCSIVGVFGFEVVVQNINLAFLDKGILNINVWIKKARDTAIASIIQYASDDGISERQRIAKKLTDKVNSRLHTYALEALGKNNYDRLVVLAKETGNVDEALFLALALTEKDPKKAKAIIAACK